MIPNHAEQGISQELLSITKAIESMERSLAQPGEHSLEDLSLLEQQRRELKKEFSRLVQETSLRLDLAKNSLNVLRARCDPYRRVEKNLDRSGVSFMDGDQVLQRSRNLLQALRFATPDTENLARLWREYSRLARRFNELSRAGMFASDILRANAKQALKLVGEQLQRAMGQAGCQSGSF
jgi:hypothetical protein